MTDRDPTEVLARAAEAGRNIRFGRGVVSKTTYVAAGVVALWTIIVWRLSGDLNTDIALMLIGLLATLFGVWFINGTQRYAERNPAQAILDGAELLEWHRMEIQAKGIPPSPNAPMVVDTSVPRLPGQSS